MIGTRGQAARVAVPAIASSQQARLIGVLGSSPERTVAVAHRLGAVAYSSLDALVDDRRVEAVWVTAPNDLHASMATELLQAGLHVLLEKPMAIDIAEATALTHVAAAAAATLRVAYQHRFRPAHRHLRDQLLSGQLGDVRRLRLHRNWPFPYFGEDPKTAPPAWRRSAAQSGGWAINDLGSHLIDLALWLTGTRSAGVVEAVFAREYPGVDNDTSAVLSLRLGAACLAGIECSNRLTSPGSVLEAYSVEGWARALNSFDTRATVTSSLHPGPVTMTVLADPYVQMLDDFVAACQGEPSMGCTAAEAALNVQLVHTARVAGRFLEDMP